MSSCLTPLLKQGHWGNLFQCLMSLTVQRRSFLFRWNLPCFSLSHCLLSCQWALLKKAWLYLLSSLPLDICMHWWHFPWIFSSPGYTVPVLPGFPHRRNAPLPSSSLWPFIGLSKVCLRVSCTGGPRTWHSTLDGASSVLSRWEGSPCLTYWQLCLMQLSIPLAFFVTRAYYWLMSYLLSTRIPRSFSTNLLSTWMASSTSWCLVPPQEPDFAFLVESHEVSTSLVSSLPRSPWVTAQLLGVSATPSRHSSFLRSSESRHHVMPSTYCMIYIVTDEQISRLWNAFVNLQIGFSNHLNCFKERDCFSLKIMCQRTKMFPACSHFWSVLCVVFILTSIRMQEVNR